MMKKDELALIVEQSIVCLQSRRLIRASHAAQMRRTFEQCRLEVSTITRDCSCVLPAPVIVGDKVLFPPVRLCLGMACDAERQRYVLYHELSHLLSAGDPVQIADNVYRRRWGVCQTVYRMENENISTYMSDDMQCRINERLNDCLACYLFREVEGVEPAAHYMNKRGDFADREQDNVIFAYLRHRILVQ